MNRSQRAGPLRTLVAQCRDITTEIHPHYREMFPGGVNEMTALDPELSATPLIEKWTFASETLKPFENYSRRFHPQQQPGWFRGHFIRPVSSLQNPPQRQPILHRHLFRCYLFRPLLPDF